MTNLHEIWKDVPGFEGLYQVSNLGKFWDLRKGIITFRRKPGRRYVDVSMQKAGIRRLESVHRLVATLFVPNPQNLPVVMHLDDNTDNNSATNLKWGTYRDNFLDAISKGRLIQKGFKSFQKGKEHYAARKVVQRKMDGSFIKVWECINEATGELKINKSGIGHCLNGLQKSTGGFKWEYYNEHCEEKKIDEQEIWRQIPNYELYYEASVFGRIRSIKSKKILKPYLTWDRGRPKYLAIKLSKNRHIFTHTVHSLILLTFEGEMPKDCDVILHLDDNMQNNHLTNLKYSTQTVNMKCSFEKGVRNGTYVRDKAGQFVKTLSLHRS